LKKADCKLSRRVEGNALNRDLRCKVLALAWERKCNGRIVELLKNHGQSKIPITKKTLLDRLPTSVLTPSFGHALTAQSPQKHIRSLSGKDVQQEANIELPWQ